METINISKLKKDPVLERLWASERRYRKAAELLKELAALIALWTAASAPWFLTSWI